MAGWTRALHATHAKSSVAAVAVSPGRAAEPKLSELPAGVVDPTYETMSMGVLLLLSSMEDLPLPLQTVQRVVWLQRSIFARRGTLTTYVRDETSQAIFTGPFCFCLPLGEKGCCNLEADRDIPYGDFYIRPGLLALKAMRAPLHWSF
jgi:hypothetical protein